MINTLRLDITDFTGRSEVIGQLMAMITASHGPTGRNIAIHSIEGMGGVGKTKLVVHVAHQLSDRYPDAALFIDLHGYDDSRKPMSTEEAAGILLSDLGVPAEKIPENLEARASLWRRELAGKRALIILDNVATPDQIRDLLAGGPGCLFMITSRRRLFELEGISTLPLDTLSPHEAITLFERVLGRETDTDQAAHVANIVRRLGYLPLAVRLAAALLRAHPKWTVREMAEMDISQDSTLRSIYTRCYRDLEPRERAFFRVLALHPGNDITAKSAAVMTRTSLAEANYVLAELYNRYLIEESLPHRFKLHDLIKEFASRETSDMSGNPERHDALLRLLEWYTFMASSTAESIGMHDLFVVATPVGDQEGAYARDEETGLDWFDAELGNLLACANYANDKSLQPFAWQIPAALTSYLRLRGFTGQAKALLQGALDTLSHVPDPVGEAIIRRRIGHIARLQGYYEVSREHLDKSLQLAEGLNDRNSLGWCHHELGHLDRVTRRLDQALAHFTEALTIQRELGNPAGQAAAETNLAVVLHDQGDPANTNSARRYLQEALRVARETADRRAEAFALYRMGALECDSGNNDRAREMLNKALLIYTDAGNRHGQADCHFHLGTVERLAGNYDAAMQDLNEALRIYVELRYRRNEADTYKEFSTTADAAGNFEMSHMHRQAAERIYDELGLGEPDASG